MSLIIHGIAPASFAQPRAPVAQVASTTGRVELHPPGAAPRRPTARERLTAGTRVVVHEGSEATIRYEGVGELQAEADAQLLMFGAPTPHAGHSEHGSHGEHGGQESSVVQGAVRVVVDPGATLRLSTPAGVVEMTAGEFRVHVDSSRDTRVASYRGRASVGGAHGTLVPQGRGARFEEGHADAPRYPPFTLPEAPVWSQPFPSSVLTLSGSATIEARFAPPPNPRHPPRGWVLELARDARFDEVVFEREAPAEERRFRAEGLPEGEYFARVSSVNIERFEGTPSTVARFRVLAPRVIPSGPGRRAEVLVPAGLFCRLDGETTLEAGVLFGLIPGRAHTLDCADNAALRGATRVPISAEQSGEIVHDARLIDAGWNPAGGTTLLELRLRDPAGRALPYVSVTARGVGVEVGPVREENERGLYVTEVRYPANTPIRVEFTVGEAQRFSVVLGGR